MAKKNALGFGGGKSFNRKKGAATIKFSKDEKRIKITWEDDELTCSAKLLPEIPEEISTTTEYYVEARLDEDDTVKEIIIRPLIWMGLKMKFVDFSRESEDSPPAPYTVEPTNEKWKPFEAFNAFMEFLDGEFKGVTVPYWMHYKFENDGKGYARWSGDPSNKKATRVRQCYEFFTLHEAVDEPIEWPDDNNVLPELYNRIMDAGVVVETAGRDGYITEMIESKTPVEKPAKKAKEPVEDEEKDDPDDDDFDDGDF